MRRSLNFDVDIVHFRCKYSCFSIQNSPLNWKMINFVSKWLGSTFSIRVSFSISKSGSYRYCNFTHGSDYCQNKDSIGGTNYINDIQDMIIPPQKLEIPKNDSRVAHLTSKHAHLCIVTSQFTSLWRHDMREHTFFLTIRSLSIPSCSKRFISRDDILIFTSLGAQ